MKALMRWTSALLAIGLLGGCAALNNVRSDVSTFGEWPAGRKPGSYAFERLPSQQSQAEQQAQLEALAAPALAAAGFQPVAAGQVPELLVQVGARVTRTELSPWSDPLWWHGGFGGWRYGPWGGPRWGLAWHDEVRRVDREVAILVRDRASGKPLYEARATSTGSTGGSPELLRAMYTAAMKDFPATGLNPRVVVVPLTD